MPGHAGAAEAPVLTRWPAMVVASPGLRNAGAAAGVSLLFVTPVLLAALLANKPTPAFWAVLIGDLVALFFFALATFRHPAVFVGAMVFWFALQRLTIALLAPHVQADTVRLLVTYKEGFYFVLLAAAGLTFLRRLRQGQRDIAPLYLVDVLAVALAALVALSFLLSSSDISPKLTYARRLAAPLLLYMGGRLLVPQRDQLLAALRLVVYAGLGVALFGLVERFLLGTGFWRDQVDALGFYGKLAESGLMPSDWIRPFEGVPEGIFSAFPLGVPVRRLVSTFLEPTTLGAFLAFVLLLVLFVPGLVESRRGALWHAAALVVAVALAATVSRGGMEGALIGAAAIVSAGVIWRGRLALPRPRLLLAVVSLVLLASLAVSSLSFSQFPNRRAQLQDFLSTGIISGFPGYEPPPPDPNAIDVGVRTHVNGLSSGLEKMWDEPLGAGLGAAGGWSEAPEVGGESAVGTVAAQLGMPGLALWVAFHALLIVSLATAALRTADRGWPAAALLTLAAAMGGLAFTAAFSESASGLLGNAVYYLFAGWALAALAPGGGALAYRWLPEGGSAPGG